MALEEEIRRIRFLERPSPKKNPLPLRLANQVWAKAFNSCLRLGTTWVRFPASAPSIPASLLSQNLP
jgi:hypothetical protein